MSVPCDGRGILDAPVRRHRLAGPDGASLAGGAVADREHEIHNRGAGIGELVPALRAKALGRVSERVQHLQREGIHVPLGWLPAE